MGMKNRFQEAIQNVQRQRHLARRSVAMVLVLAMLTAMSVSWRLHQDGIALAADDTRYYCGKEEHKHTDRTIATTRRPANCSAPSMSTPTTAIPSKRFWSAARKRASRRKRMTPPLCTTWTKTARRRAILPRNRRP